jgi:O-antigen/teichoic acid export membrane protein
VSDEIESEIAGKTLTAIRWSAFARISAQLLSWLSTIIVIRLLSPDDYGVMAMAMAAYTILAVFSEMQLASGIVQAKELSTAQLKQVLGLLTVLNFSLILILIAIAPFVARYFREPTVTIVMVVLSGTFLIMPWSNLASSILSREMRFRGKSIVDLGASVVQALLALLFAWLGFGVWALVIPIVCRAFVVGLGCCIVAKPPLIPVFRVSEIREIIRFGIFITGATLVWMAYQNIPVISGGRFLDTGSVGVYSVAFTLALVPISKVMPIIYQVVFPAFSRLNNSGVSVKYHILRMFRIIGFVTFPTFFLVGLLSQDLVDIFLGESWSQVGQPLRLLCIVMPFYAIIMLVSPVVRALGHRSLFFWNECVMFSVILLSSIIFARQGVIGLSLIWVTGIPVALLLILGRSSDVMATSMFKVLAQVMPTLVTAGASAVITALVTFLMWTSLGPVARVAAASICFAVIFLQLMFWFARQQLTEFVLFSRRIVSI